MASTGPSQGTETTATGGAAIMSQTQRYQASTDSSPQPATKKLVEACVELIDKAKKKAQEHEEQEIQLKLVDEQGRFSVWAANLGALQPSSSKKSLDYRLRDGPLMQASMTSGLQRLARVTERLLNAITTDSTTPEFALSLGISYDDPEPRTELGQLLLGIHSTISHLFSLSVLIRRLRPKGRAAPAFNHATLRDGPDNSPDMVYAMDKFPKIKNKLWLAQRLGYAISTRRENLRYRQEHWMKMKTSHQKEQADELSTGRDLQSLSGTHSTTATTYADERPDFKGQERKTSPKASIFSSATSFLTTATEGADSDPRIPDLSEMCMEGVGFLQYDEFFECPYCRTICSFVNRAEWKEHVFSDLQPYICVQEQCTPQLFRTRHEWMEHESVHHSISQKWSCQLCPSGTSTFTVKDDLTTHLSTDHTGTVTDMQIPLLADAWSTNSAVTLDTSSCLFCDNWEPDPLLLNHTKEYWRHISRHLRLLSLASIPLVIDDLEIIPRGSPALGEDEMSDISQPGQDLENSKNHTKWPDWVSEMDKALRDGTAGRSHGYIKASVLLLSWEEDHPSIYTDDLNLSERELRRLQQVFEKLYGYETEHWLIPSVDPDYHLLSKVQNFMANEGHPESLVIVYYVGHAKWGTNTDPTPIWYPSKPKEERGEGVNTSAIHQVLTRAQEDSPDVLLLYDSGFPLYSMPPDRLHTRAVVEGIFASSFEYPSPLGPNSFTNALVGALVNLAWGSRPFQVGELHEKIIQGQRSWDIPVLFQADDTLSKDGKGGIVDRYRARGMAVHMFMSKNRRSIYLSPIGSRSSSMTSSSKFQAKPEAKPKNSAPSGDPGGERK